MAFKKTFLFSLPLVEIPQVTPQSSDFLKRGFELLSFDCPNPQYLLFFSLEPVPPVF